MAQHLVPGGTILNPADLPETLRICREVGVLMDELAKLGIQPVGYRLASPYGQGQHEARQGLSRLRTRPAPARSRA